MLPSELLLSSRRNASVYPRFLRDKEKHWAQSVLDTIDRHRGKTRGELMAALRALEGDSPNYRIVRGFSHLALAKAEFGIAIEEPEPQTLRAEAFALAAEHGHGDAQTGRVLGLLAEKYGLDAEVLHDALYADLPERHILCASADFSAESLIDRYNLAQAQGLLYSALFLRINAHRNVPGEYRRLFHRLKFHGLMYTVEGSLEDGYEIHVDGPASLFRQTRKYGINMALFLPAILHISRWEMQAILQRDGRQAVYNLSSGTPLRSHYPAPPAYDSLLEQSFAERWARLDSAWALEREVEIIDLKGTVFVPDFALCHADGRVMHIEIMGFWHPDYIRRKLDKVRRAGRRNLILAISERLNVGDADIDDIAGPVIFFKGKLDPRQVLALLQNS